MAGWHFVTIPQDISEDIKNSFGDMKRGWGSLPVMVNIGTTNWKTSIFPDKKSGSYLLPVKSDVREKEKITSGDAVTFLIKIN